VTTRVYSLFVVLATIPGAGLAKASRSAPATAPANREAYRTLGQHRARLRALREHGYLHAAERNRASHQREKRRPRTELIFALGRGSEKRRASGGPKDVPRGIDSLGGWTGLAPDGSPLIQRGVSLDEIYALDWDAA
jgi:hypothetical protein